MGEWLPIESAPKDRMFLSYWNDAPVFVAWFDDLPRKEYREERVGFFVRKRYVEVGREGGWCVMTWSPRIGWGINGNCAPFTPPGWQPLPPPPQDGGK